MTKMSHQTTLRKASNFQQAYPTTSESTWQGDEFQLNKAPATTRFMFHNVNGLTLQGTDGFERHVYK